MIKRTTIYVTVASLAALVVVATIAVRASVNIVSVEPTAPGYTASDSLASAGTFTLFRESVQAAPVWDVNESFSPSADLTSAQREWHSEVIRLINNDSDNWSGAPDRLLGPANRSYCQNGVSAPHGQGTYNYGRAGQAYYRGLSTAFSATRDPVILDSMYDLAKMLQSNIKDHHGRNYRYMLYARPDVRFCNNDSIALDEVLAHALVAHIARIFDVNRDVDPKYAALADDFTQYMDQIWIPKWMNRMRKETYPEPVPGSGASIIEARWMNRAGTDRALKYFVRGLSHPDMAGMETFYTMALLTGNTDYKTHADAYCQFYKNNIIEYISVNDSYAWRHNPFRAYDDLGGNPYQETRDYGQTQLNFVTNMHREGWCFDDVDMRRVANSYYSGNTQHDVFEPGNTDLMAEDIEGGNDRFNDDTLRYTGIAGKAKFRMLSAAYLCSFDETGTIKALAETAARDGIVDQRFPDENWTTPINAAGLLTCS